MPSPDEILYAAFERAKIPIELSPITDETIQTKITNIARNLKNRACVRLLMSCLLAKIHQPNVDVRKPYTEIGGGDSFSGRGYDEHYLTSFINDLNLPCNNTTAFLTPALRNRNETLTTSIDLVGRPPQVYRDTLILLDSVYTGQVSPEDLLSETIRLLILLRDEQQQRIDSLKARLKTAEGSLPLSSEKIVILIEQHLHLPGSSRLPVLIVAAAYQAAGPLMGEKMLELNAHNAADNQTGALGDIEITLENDDNVVTSYEMKLKKVTKEDVDRALQKLTVNRKSIDNYIFITTDEIDDHVQEYALSLYSVTGVEFVILDCIGFIRHFLHLFHRHRTGFLENYQELILNEPKSAVSQDTKEAFLAMRQASETELENGV